MKIAIVGAGIAGLACADRLHDAGHQLVLFDKGRGPGGRMATRRVALGEGLVVFDHGAQYLTARDPAFADQLRRWAEAGLAARWPAAGTDAWVGVPGMSALVGDLAARHPVRWSDRVKALVRRDGAWFLDDRPEPHDAAIVAVPAEQAAPLLAAHDPAMAGIAGSSVSAPCWTAMLAFAAPVAIAPAVLRDVSIMGWAARNSAKPGRGGPEAWVVQATPDWSRDHLEDEAQAVVDALLAALAEQAGGPLPDPLIRLGHRWRYAKVRSATAGALWNPALRLGAAGDWLIGPRVEDAWRSARMLAERVALS